MNEGPLRFEPGSAIHDRNPWLGLVSYAERHQYLFYGREEEVEELRRLVAREALTVLFGQSGLGKTSLLQAGLFPHLRKAEFFPVYIRLDHSEKALPLTEQVKEILRREIQTHNVEAPAPEPGETFWEYFHRKDVDFWSTDSRLLTPVLVFDQFEEVFTIGRLNPIRHERGKRFVSELASLIENRPPASIREKLEDEKEIARFNLKQTFVKVILSLRDDYLPELEGLREEIRGIMGNRLRLLKMDGRQAFEAVSKPGKELVNPDVAEQIVRFVAAKPVGAVGGPGPAESLEDLEVEPALLSVVCRELNLKRRRLEQPQITGDLLTGNRHEILRQFYNDCFENLPKNARIFVEDRLLTKAGYRDNVALDRAEEEGVARETINHLINRRLLRLEERRGVTRVELTHDVLTEVVRESRDARQKIEAEEAAQAQLQAERAAAEKVLQQERAEARLQAERQAAQTLLEQERERAEVRVRAERQAAETRRREEEFQRERQTLELERLRALVDKRKTRRLLGVVSFAFVVAIVFMAMAIQQWKNAESQRGIAEKQRQLAENQRRVALAGELASNAREQMPTDPELSVLLAAEAVKAWPTIQAEEALRQALFRSHLRTDTRGPPNARQSFDLSADGRWAVSVMRDGHLTIWNTRTNQILGELTLGTNAPTAAALSSDGHLLIVAVGNTASILETQSGRLVAELPGHSDRIESVAFGSGGGLVVTTSWDKSSRVWEVRTGRPVAVLRGHTALVTGAALSTNGQWVATASADRTARVWATESGKEVASFDRHGSRINGVAFSPDGRLVVTAGDDKQARVWEASSGQQISVLAGHEDSVDTAIFSPDGHFVLTVSRDKTARVWDPTTGENLGILRGNKSTPIRVVSSGDSETVVTLAADNRVQSWHTGIGRRVAEHSAPVLTGILSFDGQLAVTGDGDGMVAVCESDGRTLATWTAHDGQVLSTALSPDGARVVTSGSDTGVYVWNTRTGKKVISLEGHIGAVNTVAYSPDGQWIASAGSDGTAMLWEAQTGRQVAKLEPSALERRTPVLGVVFNSDSRFVITWSSDKSVRVWSASLRKLVAEISLPQPVIAASLALDNRFVLTGTEDGNVSRWEVLTGALIDTVELQGSRGLLTSAAISPDGQFIMAASTESNNARIWKTDTGHLLFELTGHIDGINTVAFSGNEQLALTGSKDHTARIHSTKECDPLQRLLLLAAARVQRNLTTEERKAFLPHE